jgi:hypothetical protein
MAVTPSPADVTQILPQPNQANAAARLPSARANVNTPFGMMGRY